jgi:hypothetical protein
MQLETIKELIDERDSLDSNLEEYQELTDEIKLLQNDLVTIAILGEN